MRPETLIEKREERKNEEGWVREEGETMTVFFL